MTERDTAEFERLLAGTQSPDLLTRLQTIEALGKSGNAHAVGLLIALLADPEWMVCVAAVKALGALGDSRAAEPIAQVANRDDILGITRAVETAQAIADALRGMGEPGFQALLHVLRNHADGEFMGCAAVCALDELHDRRAIDALVLALNSPVFEVSQAASHTLSHFREEALPLFVAALESPNYYARFHARMALYDFDTAPLPLLLSLLQTNSQTETRVESIHALTSLDDDAVDEALRAVLNDSDTAVRNAAVEALGARGDMSMIDLLLDLPRDPQKGTDWIVEILKDFGPDTVSLLLRALRDASRTVDARLRAMDTLDEIEGVDAVPMLLESLHDSDERVQIAAAKALGHYSDERTVPALLPLLSSESSLLRRVVVAILAHFGRPEVFDDVLNIAMDPSVYYPARISALRTLRTQFKERAQPVLRNLVLGDDPQVAFVAISALFFPQSQNTSGLLELAKACDWQRRLTILSRLTSNSNWEQDAQLIAYLRELLDNPQPEVCFFAARVLGETGDQYGIDALVETLQSDMPGMDVAAARLLAKLGDSRALPTLERALEKLDVALDDARTASDNRDMAQRQRTMRLYEERDELLSAILSLRRVEYEQSIIDERK